MKALANLLQRALERRLKVSAAYLGKMGETSPAGFLKFLLFLPLAAHQGRSRTGLVDAVRLVATQAEDCGSCLQIAITAALDNGLRGSQVLAVLDRNFDRLARDLEIAVRFADGVLLRDGSEAHPRQELEDRFGPRVVTDLSLAIASARLFPTLKRGMGYATSCSKAVCEPLAESLASRASQADVSHA